MSNSPLVNYTRISPNQSGKRNHAIDTVTIHCVVGQCSVETLGSIFADFDRQASANYGIGADGRIGMYVQEDNRSWCSSDSANDHRAITIEVASDTYAPYAVNDRAMNALITLLVDICKRHPKIGRLRWRGDKALIGAVDKQNMTAHRWFASTECPGEFLYSRFGDIAAKVNQRLDAEHSRPTSSTWYRVRKAWDDAKSQLGAFVDANNAVNLAKSNPGFKVFDANGSQVYPKPAQTPSSGEKKVGYALSYNPGLFGTYKVTTPVGLNVRYDAGDLSDDNIIDTLTEGSRVQNYGYYSDIRGTRWLLIEFGGRTGFASADYLSRI